MATLVNYISNQEKLNRTYRLTIQDVDEKGNPIDKAIVITPPFTINFNVNRTLFAEASTLDVEIYNLAPQTYKQLFWDYFDVRRRTVILEAGYDSFTNKDNSKANMSIIFIGDMWSCYTSRQGSDIITKIHCIVGLKSLQVQTDATLANISRNQIIRHAATDMALDVEIYSGEDTKLTRPVVLRGNSMNIIQKYTGNNAFIDNNKLIVLEGQDAIKGDIVLINDESGLLGVPKHEDAILSVDIIFEPRIMIGQLIEIQSRIMPEFDGQYKVFGIKHEGTISDSVSGSATTTLEMLVGSKIFGRLNVKRKQ